MSTFKNGDKVKINFECIPNDEYYKFLHYNRKNLENEIFEISICWDEEDEKINTTFLNVKMYSIEHINEKKNVILYSGKLYEDTLENLNKYEFDWLEDFEFKHEYLSPVTFKKDNKMKKEIDNKSIMSIVENKTPAYLSSGLRYNGGKVATTFLVDSLKDSANLPFMLKAVLQEPYAQPMVGALVAFALLRLKGDDERIEILADSIGEYAGAELIGLFNIDKFISDMFNKLPPQLKTTKKS